MLTRKKNHPRNTHDRKFWTHEYPRENFDSRNTHEKKFQTHEIPTKKNFGPKKYPREKILDSRNTHEDMMARWH